MKNNRIFFVVILSVALLYLAFIVFFNKYAKFSEQEAVNKHANIVSKSLWSFNSDLAEDYLQLACKTHKYKKVVVLFPSNEQFLSIDCDLDNPVDLFFYSLSLFGITPLSSQIVHKGQVIGKISVEWYNTTIYAYIYVLIIIILLLTVFWFISVTLKHKNELEDRVKERTFELEREVKEREQGEETRRRILEASIGGIYIYDLNLGRNVYANAQYTALTGYTFEEISSMERGEFSNLFHPDDQSEVIEHMRSVTEDLPDGSNLPIDYRFKHAKGEWRWFRSCDAVYGRDENGGVRQFIGSFIDITDQKQSEMSLKENEERYRSLIEYSSDHLFMLSTQGTYIESNGRLSAFELRPGDSLIGKSLKEVYEPELASFYQGKLDEVIDKEVSIDFEHQMKTSKGLLYHFDTLYPIYRGGKLWAIGGICRDITERNRLEKERMKLQHELHQSQKMEAIGTLAGGIAHDFNNVLSSVIGFTELALDEVKPGTVLQDNLQEVYSAGKRAKDLVWQILAYARQTEESSKPIQVDTIVKEVLKLIRSSIPTTIDIEQNIESDSLVMGHPTQIHQIIMNLCTNAAHAMDEKGGVLQVELKDIRIKRFSDEIFRGMKSGEYVEIAVSDTGHGIPPEIMDSIFEPYFTTKGPGKGTGMGLAVVQGIAEKLGGKITVESQVRKGSIFKLYLPINKKYQVQGRYEPEKLPTGTECILFVDDEAPIARMGGQVLSRLGYTVTTRTSSLEALELFRLKPNDFDLVITDMTMPNMTGDLLAIELLSIRSDIPIILCTGYSNKISDESTSEIGIKALAYKPIVKADLAKTVRKILDDTKK